MLWLALRFSGPFPGTLRPTSTNIPSKIYFKSSNPAVLMVFTAIVGVIALPLIWLFQPSVLNLPFSESAIVALSGAMDMATIGRRRALTRHFGPRAGFAGCATGFGSSATEPIACAANRRIASERDGPSDCRAIQASRAVSSLGGNRTFTGVAPMAGRPRRDCLALDIALLICSFSSASK
jgi:hypothetical protein